MIVILNEVDFPDSRGRSTVVERQTEMTVSCTTDTANGGTMAMRWIDHSKKDGNEAATRPLKQSTAYRVNMANGKRQDRLENQADLEESQMLMEQSLV